ncbi:hypothetical protein E1A91_D12G041300v1 [Gossypium mustelinum]|uniref:Uncharacterized protein n=3 Tax=Gossypium TaxID=3633 RepID=A0A5J5NU04_GOSBA|nr:hypothetical protein ES319_D12G041500v1 [Gossypium barbadense]TYG39787.1 hypothetical protein ES288_D12G043500v1 [Gossypium darwinii]TYI49524.1 hypothetical protein E1A91_D12G041300v1 [Gossypium mustelinum]
MFSTALNQKPNFHARSNSIDEHLCRLKSNETASSSSHSINQKLNDLRDVYDLVDSLLQLPHSQNSLAQQCTDKQVDELLNGSLRLLDVCGVAKSALLQAKEDTQKLQSILRKKGDEAEIITEAKGYLASRKKAKK